MSDLKLTHAFTGSPSQIGGQIFVELIAPIIQQVSDDMPPTELARLFAGFLGATSASLASYLGQENAELVMQQVVTVLTEQGPQAAAEQRRPH